MNDTFLHSLMEVLLCLSDPGSVNLEKVSNIIIDQSLKDQMFSKEAGRICYTIVQVKPPNKYLLEILLEKIKNVFLDLICSLSTTICLTFTGYRSQAEAKQNNGSVFRRNLLNRLQQEFKNREEKRKCSLQEWVCFVTFICNIFDYLKVIRLSLGFLNTASSGLLQVSNFLRLIVWFCFDYFWCLFIFRWTTCQCWLWSILCSIVCWD